MTIYYNSPMMFHNHFFDVIKDFIYRYYIAPIIYDTGYNPVNTITWAVLLVVGIFFISKLWEIWDDKWGADRDFVLSLIPYIFVGASLRVMEDANVFDAPLRYLFITPLNFVTMVALSSIILLISVAISAKLSLKKGSYKKIFVPIGIIWCSLNVTILLNAKEVILFWVPFAVVGIAILIVFPIYLIARAYNIQFLKEKLNVCILGAHLMDAASSHIGIDYLNYSGKHVIERILLEHTGTALCIYPSELLVLIPALYLIDKYSEKESIKMVLLGVILVLGLAPAIRNTMRMTLLI